MSRWRKFGDSVINYLGDYLVQKPYDGELLSHDYIHDFLLKNQSVFLMTDPVVSYTTNSFLSFDEDRNSHHIVMDGNYQLFGVYDGHVGSSSAQFLHHHLLREIEDEILYSDSDNLSEKLIEAFRTCDKKLIQQEKMSGSTAIVTCIDNENKIAYIANTGNCKAVLGLEGGESDSDGDEWITEVLTFEHLAELEEEELREMFPNDPDIVENGKIKGLLDYSRTFGDALFKRGGRMLCGDREDWNPPYINVDPEITILELDNLFEEEEDKEEEEEDLVKFIVLGSEGLWRNMSANQVVHLVGESLKNGEDGTVSVLGGVLETVAQRGMDFEERVSSVILTPGGFLKMICQDVTVSVIVLS